MSHLFDKEFQKNVDLRKEIYTPGTRVRCLKLEDEYAPVHPGILGSVNHVDDHGTVFVDWDNGSSLGAVIFEDHIEKFDENPEG